MIPIFHDLRHGTCHAACIAVTARTAPPAAPGFRSVIVVRIILIPQCLNQRRYSFCVFSRRQFIVFQRFPLSFSISGNHAVGIAIIDVFTVVFDKIPSRLWNLAVVTVSERIRQHRLHVFGGRHYHKTAALDIENIQIWLSVDALFSVKKTQLRLLVSGLIRYEISTNLLGKRFIYKHLSQRTIHRQKHDGQRQYQPAEIFFIHFLVNLMAQR